MPHVRPSPLNGDDDTSVVGIGTVVDEDDGSVTGPNGPREDSEVALTLIERLSGLGVVPRSLTVGSVTIEVASTDWGPRTPKASDRPRPGTQEWYRERHLTGLSAQVRERQASGDGS